ncbi:MAG: secondary thiamine-phosphate synthase enzyme YjbQ [Gammaproteobacteria bacterium]
MSAVQETLKLRTSGRATTDITEAVANVVSGSGVETGLCHVFARHTSAGIIITENADPTVRDDLERLLAHLAPDGWDAFRHTAEGDDDMSAHARTLLTGEGVLIPVTDGTPGLGVWQGIFLWEHRTGAHRREVTITVLGEQRA